MTSIRFRVCRFTASTLARRESNREPAPRIPAVRGKILDRNGTALAENRPTYNVSLYLDELRKSFDEAHAQAKARAQAVLT